MKENKDADFKLFDVQQREMQPGRRREFKKNHLKFLKGNLGQEYRKQEQLKQSA